MNLRSLQAYMLRVLTGHKDFTVHRIIPSEVSLGVLRRRTQASVSKGFRPLYSYMCWNTVG